jgi:hypothetical protein
VEWQQVVATYRDKSDIAHDHQSVGRSLRKGLEAGTVPGTIACEQLLAEGPSHESVSFPEIPSRNHRTEALEERPDPALHFRKIEARVGVTLA